MNLTKGEQLEFLLKETEKNHTKMNFLFLKDKNRTPDLSLLSLSDSDRDEWYKLYNKNKEFEKQIIELLN
jgi:hypothetical protein